ncbi:uncharacterized protein LOC106172853 [Lingula anatina]|uniref:Uncharacterized protein LOC106172853 n=1 Tax=Lingula anatina TaxID=7574 RepID=A0A1S3JFT3_LINAN|nr:uncharacterized protein LOC106172853 [Lingula anatina]|eukprot:XP_013409218.1 uncharacterized protein LOC106172853 [Lingula anatina]
MRTTIYMRNVLVVVLMILVIKTLYTIVYVRYGPNREVNAHGKITLDVLDLQLPTTGDFKCVELKVTSTISAPICVYEVEEDKYVSGALSNGGIWQKDNIDVFRLLANEDPELNLIDLGANLGTWTIIAAALGKQVIAVEPFPPTISRLHRSLQLGHLESRVTLVTNPLSDKYEDVVFKVYPSNKGGVAIAAKNSSGDLLDHSTVKKTTTLNDLASIIPGGFNKAFMKMDIEGMELKALNASDVLFSVVDIPVILTEWMAYRKRLDKPEVRYFEVWFTNAGYVPCYIETSRSSVAQLEYHLLGSIKSDVKWKEISDVFLIKKNVLEEFKGRGRLV